jgi:hypothetical protein
VLHVGVEMVVVVVVRSVGGLGLVVVAALVLGHDLAGGEVEVAVDRLAKVDSDSANGNPQCILRN